MNRPMLEALRAELHQRVDAAIDAALTALSPKRRQVLPPQENTPVDELAQQRARRVLRKRGYSIEEGE